MTVRDRWLLGVRVVVLLFIGILVAVTISLIDFAGVRAPLLTMMGGATIIMTLFPPRSLAIQDIVRDFLTVIGTGIAIAGGMYWLTDATRSILDDGPQLNLSFTLFQMLLWVIVIYVVMSIFIVADWGRVKRGLRRALRR